MGGRGEQCVWVEGVSSVCGWRGEQCVWVEGVRGCVECVR